MRQPAKTIKKIGDKQQQNEAEEIMLYSISNQASLYKNHQKIDSMQHASRITTIFHPAQVKS